jgi:hypothetical protein
MNAIILKSLNKYDQSRMQSIDFQCTQLIPYIVLMKGYHPKRHNSSPKVVDNKKDY